MSTWDDFKAVMVRETGRTPDLSNPEDAARFYGYQLAASKAEAQSQGGGEVAVPWVEEWQGSGPQCGYHIREATRLHNNRVVAYLGDQVSGAEVDKLIAAHNGKHPNGDPVRTACPSAPVGELVSALQSMRDRMMSVLPSKFGEAFDGDFDTMLEAIRALKKHAAPPSALVGVEDSLVQTALRNLPQYISKSGLVGPDKHSAMQCFEVLQAALAQQQATPKGEGCASCGDLADFLDEGGLCASCWCAQEPLDALAQQPAPIAPVGVEGVGYEKARELLAAAYSDAGCFSVADRLLRTAYVRDAKEVVALRAIEMALAQQPASEGHPERWRLDDRELSAGRLKALHRGIDLARKWSNGTGVHGHTDRVVRDMAEELREALSEQEGDYDQQPAAAHWVADAYGGYWQVAVEGKPYNFRNPPGFKLIPVSKQVP